MINCFTLLSYKVLNVIGDTPTNEAMVDSESLDAR